MLIGIFLVEVQIPFVFNLDWIWKMNMKCIILNCLQAAFDSGMVDMRDFDSDIHTVAGAMKLYLRELPDPLMTCDLYQEWMQAANL